MEHVVAACPSQLRVNAEPDVIRQEAPTGRHEHVDRLLTRLPIETAAVQTATTATTATSTVVNAIRFVMSETISEKPRRAARQPLASGRMARSWFARSAIASSAVSP